MVTIKALLKPLLIGAVFGGLLAACGVSYPEAPVSFKSANHDGEYVIGAGDALSIFVWRNPDLSTEIPVRPDGRISVPLVEDLMAAGRTPKQLGDELETILGKYIQNPNVTVIVTGFVGPYAEQIRIVGEALSPAAIPYRQGMTVLDAVIQVGGLTEFAAGNRAVLMRTVAGEESTYRVRLNDLIKSGDVSANVALVPGDVLIIPVSRF